MAISAKAIIGAMLLVWVSRWRKGGYVHWFCGDGTNGTYTLAAVRANAPWHRHRHPPAPLHPPPETDPGQKIQNGEDVPERLTGISSFITRVRQGKSAGKPGRTPGASRLRGPSNSRQRLECGELAPDFAGATARPHCSRLNHREIPRFFQQQTPQKLAAGPVRAYLA